MEYAELMRKASSSSSNDYLEQEPKFLAIDSARVGVGASGFFLRLPQEVMKIDCIYR